MNPTHDSESRPRSARRTGLAGLSAVSAAGLGLLYVLYAFGPTEQEVATWGEVTFYGGLALALLAVVTRRIAVPALGMILALGLSALALFQVLPALLWVLFHTSGISDGSPPSAFVAHWAYALPHIAVAVLCLAAAYRLLAQPPAAAAANSDPHHAHNGG